MIKTVSVGMMIVGGIVLFVGNLWAFVDICQSKGIIYGMKSIIRVVFRRFRSDYLICDPSVSRGAVNVTLAGLMIFGFGVCLSYLW